MTAKRVLISIDDRLLARVDQARTRQGITRSAYLAQLAERDLQAAVGPGSSSAVRDALTALDALLGDTRS